MTTSRCLLLACLLSAQLATSNSPAHAGSVEDWDKMRSIVPRGYVCMPATGPLRIDGRLDDPAWKHAAWTDRFVDIQGKQKPKPRFQTRAKMLWDKNYFYIAADMIEPHVWGTLTKHDSVIFHDNDFEVFIDPDGDTHQYFEFEMNALNTGWDLFLPKPYKDGGRADNGWEIPGLKTAVSIRGTLNDPSDTDTGWSVEIAIPWSTMRASANRPSPPRSGDQWRVNFSRVEWKHSIQNGMYSKVPKTREDNWVWSPQGIIDMHRPEMWGYVQFSDGRTSTKFRPDPSGPARMALMTVYHHQKSYRRQHKAWAKSLQALGLGDHKWPRMIAAPTITLTTDGYVATVLHKTRDGRNRIYQVRSDSKLTAGGRIGTRNVEPK